MSRQPFGQMVKQDWMFKIPQKPLPLPTVGKAHTGHMTSHRPVGMPYVKSLSEQLQRVFRKHNIQLYHQPWNTLRQKLVHPKDQLDIEKKCDVIYHMECPDCNLTYVGETCRSFGQRFKEHSKIKGNYLTAIGEHCAKTKHKMSIESCKILDSADQFHSRKVKEALFIKRVEACVKQRWGTWASPHLLDTGLQACQEYTYCVNFWQYYHLYKIQQWGKDIFFSILDKTWRFNLSWYLHERHV